MIEIKKWYFRIYLFFVRILIVSMIIGISFPIHVFGTTSDHAGQNWKINVSSNERQVVPDELKQLYALSAVLMDADSGRILFSKNGQEERAMASTTKIMTCILGFGKSDCYSKRSGCYAAKGTSWNGCRRTVLFKRSSLFLNAGVT